MLLQINEALKLLQAANWEKVTIVSAFATFLVIVIAWYVYRERHLAKVLRDKDKYIEERERNYWQTHKERETYWEEKLEERSGQTDKVQTILFDQIVKLGNLVADLNYANEKKNIIINKILNQKNEKINQESQNQNLESNEKES